MKRAKAVAFFIGLVLLVALPLALVSGTKAESPGESVLTGYLSRCSNHIYSASSDGRIQVTNYQCS